MEIREQAEMLNRLIGSYNEAHPFLMALSRGDLNVPPPAGNPLIAPFKKLHANLRHLTWQTQQIVAGDLSQKVEFLGDYSAAFNKLIEALKEKRQTEEQLQFLSNHDTLTGAYNRGYFNVELERICRGRRFPVSIIMADLDQLKAVNDNRGHAAGDRLLRQAAKVLTMAVRGEDVVARIGGDEFAVILAGSDTDAAAKVLERIREEELAYNRTQDEFTLGISLGLATARDRDAVDEACKLADQRMYEDKAVRRAAGVGTGSGPCRS
jgi:diguanylate cyclase (GGDEF)-like protein